MSELLDFLITHEEAFKSRNRLASLYSDFRSQLNTNPDGYHANVAAWKKALADAARAGVIPATGNGHDLLNIRTGDELASALQHQQYGRPTCLPAVIHDAVSKKEMIPLKDFLASPTSIYKSSWVPSPWGVLQWGLRQIGVLGQPGFGDKLDVGNFVVLSNVEAAANELLKQMSSHTSAVDRILSRSEFLKRYADVLNPAAPLSSNDLNILLLHLARDKQEISYNAQTIKFKPENEPLPLPISQEDTAIAQLRDTIAKINAQISPLTEKVASADKAAREAVKGKQMIRAKAALRSKKLAESALAQRTDVALQLEGVYAKLQEAADQIEIVEAMKASAVALKGLNKRIGGVEGVSGVVDVLREEMATADDITNIINEAGEPVDEMEIDDEFEALERVEKEKREAEEAAKTAARLAELELLEKERREKEREKEIQKENEKENAKESKRIEEAKEEAQMSQSLARMSFVEEAEKDDAEKGKIATTA
ncbi:hypothetical protein K505DRAFT_322280 [Melanomma pulvis-pyrius CBS 109.77]|uniref:Snf7-domain-containing protein n=1 Tax=Melanomma pulvis-pyrius CBS 109.77 TaxID=1314802 RepID=A0A6A6XNK7_9PLEO|nr:hypothetical protein K505DRAFT_322280 [Melanomma pulvis-pyrius CBS 109.77]